MCGIGRASSGNTTADRGAVVGGVSGGAVVGLDVENVVGVAGGCGGLVTVGADVLVGGTGDNVGHSSGVGADSVGSGVGEKPLPGASTSRPVRPTVHAVSDQQMNEQTIAVLFTVV
jgi:hypothetical protein